MRAGPEKSSPKWSCCCVDVSDVRVGCEHRGVVAARRVTAKTRIHAEDSTSGGPLTGVAWRRVLVPGEMNLAELHEVMQTAMGEC